MWFFLQDSVSSSVTTSTFGQAKSDQPRRRYSNLSNLAQSLPSTISSVSGFPVAAAGSLDLESAAASGAAAASSSHAKRSHSSSSYGGGGLGHVRQRRRKNKKETTPLRHSATIEKEDLMNESEHLRGASSLESGQKSKTKARHKDYSDGDGNENRSVVINLVPGDCDSQSEDGGMFLTLVYDI